ncbi:dihydropteroate synthase [Pedobacter sp. PWIIR3]
MAKDTFLYRKTTLNLRGKLLDLAYPCVMGIINITPDSFYGDSRVSTEQQAMNMAEKHLNEGAVFLDLGAYSSRPGAEDIDEEEELSRLIPMVEAIHKNFPEAFLSIDTFRSKVARAAVESGAHLINDISGGSLDDQMFETVASLQVPYVLMHMKGTPQTMKNEASYADFRMEVNNYFSDKIAALKQLGVKDVILDPGFGFAKTTAHNFELLNHLEDLQHFGYPLLSGISRKGMIYKTLEITADKSLNGTTALNTISLMKGASILRVHDVKEAVQCVTLVQKTLQEYPD